MVKKCWVGFLREMRYVCITSSPAPKRSRWFGKTPKNSHQKNLEQFCQQTKWSAWFFGMRKGSHDRSTFSRAQPLMRRDTDCEMLKNLRKAIKRKRPDLLIKGVIQLHDNAPPHNVNVTQEILQQFQWNVFRHPPYSPNSLHSILHFFQTSRSHWVGKSFLMMKMHFIPSSFVKMCWVVTLQMCRSSPAFQLMNNGPLQPPLTLGWSWHLSQQFSVSHLYAQFQQTFCDL